MKNDQKPRPGFAYQNLPYRFHAYYKDGEWDSGELVQDSEIKLSEAAVCLHYGQEIFEGLKAYRSSEGSINLFRPLLNAERMRDSAERMMMAPVPTELFLRAVQSVVQANQEWVPPYGKQETLYLRPLLIGTQAKVGVDPSSEYLFIVFATPVGSYYSGDLKPGKYLVSDFDRAAGLGTGAVKTGGNYAASLYPSHMAKAAGFSDALFLDPLEHRYIDETTGANFFGITKSGQFLTPKSPSILPSITKRSILVLAEEMGLHPAETKIPIDEIDDFVEAGAMGTAAVISPIGSITYQEKKHIIGSETTAGPFTQKLRDELIGIQFGDIEDRHNWLTSACASFPKKI
ncbi:MAG: branched-chain amino acid aminotransferase [Bifidobacteriaceae bacterium]|jgi:branched-chain amino acid aminotransferase|nr:branched-chain amino acid aminotransferase [Bifidobacteriaceae bacterium]